MAWGRFLNLNMSGPDLAIPKPMLLQHFRQGLCEESAILLDTSSGGSFIHLTLSEGKVVLNKILDNTPYTGIFDEFPNEEVKETPELNKEIQTIKPTSPEPEKEEPPLEKSHRLEA